MKLSEIFLNEYIIVPEQTFRFPMVDTIYVGRVQYKNGILLLHKHETIEEIAFIANIPDYSIDSSNPKLTPVAYLGFLKYQGVLMAKNAYTLPTFQKKGILSEMFYFVNKIDKHPIISDLELSVAGEAVWKSMIKSSAFDVKIFYVPTLEIFDLSDIKKTQASDGEIVQSPADDNKNDKMFSETNPNGQKYFYLIEGKDIFSMEYNGKLFERHFTTSSHLPNGNILQPYRYFRDGDI